MNEFEAYKRYRCLYYEFLIRNDYREIGVEPSPENRWNGVVWIGRKNWADGEIKECGYGFNYDGNPPYEQMVYELLTKQPLKS